MSVKALQKRLDRLEGACQTLNYEQMALGVLSDCDLDLLEEACLLRDCGHNDAEIAEMMGARWQVYLKVVDKIKTKYDRLVKSSEHKPQKKR